MNKISVYLFVLFSVLSIQLSAQQVDFGLKKEQPSYQGIVVDITNNLPISQVKITIKELNITAFSDDLGFFKFKGIPNAAYTYVFYHPGYLEYEQLVDNKAPLNIKLTPNSLELDEIVILGKSSSHGGTTATHINRKAIEHLQATSLQEVLQLAPGSVISNPTFSNTGQANIRQYSADKLGSLGTSIVINGATISNNASLQAINTATAGSSASFSTSSGAGVDLRTINADNIESVEILRGIPSVEYGDLNSGALIVQTKASKEPLQLKARFNPKLTQFWGGKGFQIGKDKGSLFVDIDYTHSNDSETNLYQTYDRVTANAQYTVTLGKNKNWRTNTTLGIVYSDDVYGMDPDFVVDQIENTSKERTIRFSTNGTINVNSSFSETIKYNISSSYGNQKGYQQQYYTADVGVEANALQNGTNRYDYLPSSYLSQMWLEGKPFSFATKVSNQFHRYHGRLSHAILVGVDWKTDANFGNGKSFTRPPRAISGASYRVRSFNDIPALNQLGFFAQDHVNIDLGSHSVTAIAGLRYDMIQPGNKSYNLNALSPRVNVLWNLPHNFTIRGGYGITAKAPTLLYLYPENAYFDFYSLNYYKENENERLALITTHVYNTENHNLKLSKTNKKELGFDYHWQKSRFSLTAYHEKTKNGYNMSTTLQSIQFAENPVYQVVSQPSNQQPIISDNPTYQTNMVSYSAPNNNINRTNKGVEFELDLGKFEAINTAFNVTGAYSSTRSLTNDYYILQQNVANKEATRIGVFAPRGSQDERFITTIRAVHHIPKLRLIASLTAQTIWADKSKYVGHSKKPVGYIPIQQENEEADIIFLSQEEQNQINVIDDPDLFLSLNDQIFVAEKWKPLWLFNLKLTKEFKNGLNFSFFANNFVNYRPLQSSTRYPNVYYKRNIDFFFGMEVSIKL